MTWDREAYKRGDGEHQKCGACGNRIIPDYHFPRSDGVNWRDFHEACLPNGKPHLNEPR